MNMGRRRAGLALWGWFERPLDIQNSTALNAHCFYRTSFGECYVYDAVRTELAFQVLTWYTKNLIVSRLA